MFGLEKKELLRLAYKECSGPRVDSPEPSSTMIYPQANNTSAGGSAGKRAGKNSSFAEKRGGVARKNGKGGKPLQQVVQWKQKNVEEGIVVVDEQQLSKLIKREPIEKYYALDSEPFATGLFATVRRCVSLDTGEVFAAKFSSRARYGEDCSAEIHHEIALLSLCAPSPRIVKLHDVFETPTEIIILMQFAPGGDLQTVIDDNLVPFETDVVNFVRQLVEGLAYLHERKIAHLDIKPQNLVMMGDFPNCDVKLCDFEISRVILEGTEIREILGTPDYVAPEILHYEPITLAADLWSLGVTTYVLLTGFSPFGGETDQETFCNISRAHLDFPEELFEDVSQDAKDFIRQLLVREPGARPTAKNLLKHRWLSRQSAPRCRTTTTNNNNAGVEKNLRKYLSKSREALFERVVQQQQRNNDLRKTTLLSQYNKTRMCESHTSLVSRTREERPLIGLSPSFSRSREKLYGLRSLSRSHEGLDLLRLSGREGGRKAYARATTADLSTLTTPPTPGPDDDATPRRSAIDEEKKPRDRTFRKINSDSCIAVPSLVSPTLLRNTLEQCAKLVTAASETNSNVERENTTHVNGTGHIKDEPTSPATAFDIHTTTEQSDEMHNEDANIQDEMSPPQNHLNPTPKHEKTSANHVESSKTDTTIASDEPPRITKVITDELKVRVEEVIEEQQPMENNRAEEKEITSADTKEEPKSSDTLDTTVPDEEVEEPSFTVAQLISAYNRHQEIVTKTSLEVTMTAGDRTAKMLPVPIVARDPSTKFPTGPTALRLFIPDIDIETTKKKKNRTKSYRTLARSTIVAREVVREDPVKEEVSENGFSTVTDLDNANNSSPTTETSPEFLRSVSLSSETSGGLTPTSETFSSLSWEELTPAMLPPDSRCAVAMPDTHSGAATPNPWGRLCNGSYTRAMEKFGGRSEQQQQPKIETTTITSNNNTRKCSLSMLFPLAIQEDEKVRRKSTSVIVKLS